jgi:small GTP-binding protein
MADIFLSYAREDRKKASLLAKVLESSGFSVFFDRTIPVGTKWIDFIQQELEVCKCIIVLWSKASVESNWIREEAYIAKERGVLIPVLIEEVHIPLGFRAIQAANLIGWTGNEKEPEFLSLVKALQVTMHGAVEIVQQSVSEVAVDGYLTGLKIDQQDLIEVKILFVGDGGSGKTSLLKRLTSKAFNVNEPQTHGINIEREALMLGDVEIRLNLWDFGGQEIMHSTHQFFLSKRSLYILVLDGRKEKDPEYWLKHIQTFGGTSPIIVVLNKIDENPSFEVNRKFLQEKYKTIKGFNRVSCRTNEGITELFDALRKEISSIEHLRTPWPSSWFRVKTKLEKLTENFISFEKYENICHSEGITDEDTIESLANLLNDIGVVLHFDTAFLRETNVINPAWITKAVYQILNSKKIAEGKGLLNRKALKEILKSDEYPKRKHDYIIELMKKFELCFSINEENILVPDLLDIEEPQFDFDYDNVLRFQIEYEFFPKSIIAKLIVNLHTDIKDRLRWRTGVVLEDEAFGARALIRADEKEKKIEIVANGSERREYFSIIRKTILDINSSFRGLRFKEMVPCVCSECQRSGRQHLFDYKYLLDRRKKGKTTVDCQQSIEEVSLQDLFAGIESPKAQPYDGWDVFISYSSKDLPTVTDVIRELKGHQVRCWWDEEQIKPGDSISKMIELGLRKSHFIMPCISRNQVESGWCRVEYTSALHKVLRGKTSQRVTPLILDDLPDEELPILLSDFRSERLNDPRGYKRLVTFLSGR